MYGIKHLIQCHCILPQYRSAPDPIFHKFVVFSIVDDSDTVQPKYVQCNNCGVVHKIIDLCRSELMTGREELRSVTTIDEIKLTLPRDISTILESYDVDLPTWENSQFIYLEKRWGHSVILTRDELDGEVQGKLLVFKDNEKYQIESFIAESTINTAKA